MNVRAQESYAASPAGKAEQQREEQRLVDTTTIDMATGFVENRLRDPASAVFTDLRVVRRGGAEAVCGSVNSKNGFGGMSGAQPFVVTDFKVQMPSFGADAIAEIRKWC